MRLFYTIGIWFYVLGIRLAALFGHTKARLMVRGWRESGQWPVVSGQPVAWFHAASLGEFEQARPVLERYKEQHPDSRIVVTFFSPSGYEVRKNYDQADAVMYLPPDLPGSVRRFIDKWQPTVAFFVKYEFWFNYLGELQRRGIPTYLFSAIFRPGQYFFKPWGAWCLHQLRRCYTHIFVQNEESLSLLQSHGVERCSLAGDTRFDRVHQIALAGERNEVVERWLEGHNGKVLVAGSTWPPDEALLQECVNALTRECVNQTDEFTNSQINTLKIILAPHVIGEDHLKQIEHLFTDSVRYSSIASHTSHASYTSNASILIIDNIGILSKLYRYADVAYIGGGFGVGIHNILEAVTFGKPVLFGPNYHKFQEAHDIIARGGGFSHRDADSLRRNIEPLLTDPEALKKASQACTAYMQENLGSTEKIINKVNGDK